MDCRSCHIGSWRVEATCNSLMGGEISKGESTNKPQVTPLLRGERIVPRRQAILDCPSKLVVHLVASSSRTPENDPMLRKGVHFKYYSMFNINLRPIVMP